MAEVKITKRERFEEMATIFTEMGRNDLVAFCDHEVELLAKKNASRSSDNSKKAKEQAMIMAEVKNALIEVGVPTTVTNLLRETSLNYSSQRVSAMLKKLVDKGEVTKATDKKSVLYSI